MVVTYVYASLYTCNRIFGFEFFSEREPRTLISETHNFFRKLAILISGSNSTGKLGLHIKSTRHQWICLCLPIVPIHRGYPIDPSERIEKGGRKYPAHGSIGHLRRPNPGPISERQVQQLQPHRGRLLPVRHCPGRLVGAYLCLLQL